MTVARGKVRELFSELLEDEDSEDNPLREIAGARELMKELVTQLRGGLKEIHDPKAQAILETSAEVIKGLLKAFDDYEKKTNL